MIAIFIDTRKIFYTILVISKTVNVNLFSTVHLGKKKR